MRRTRQKARRTATALTCLLVCLSFACALAGCPDSGGQAMSREEAIQLLEKSQAWMGRVEPLLADANETIRVETARIATMPAGPQRDEAQKAVDTVRVFADQRKAELAKVSKGVADLTAALRDANSDADAVENVGRVAGAATPQPWGTYIVLGTGLLAALMRARSNRVAGRQIAESLAPILTEEQKLAIRKSAVQKWTAKGIVDEATGDARPLPI